MPDLRTYYATGTVCPRCGVLIRQGATHVTNDYATGCEIRWTSMELPNDLANMTPDETDAAVRAVREHRMRKAQEPVHFDVRVTAMKRDTNAVEGTAWHPRAEDVVADLSAVLGVASADCGYVYTEVNARETPPSVRAETKALRKLHAITDRLGTSSPDKVKLIEIEEILNRDD